MPSKSSQHESDPLSMTPSAAYSEQWWRAAGYEPFPLPTAGGNASNHALIDNPVESLETAQSKDDQSVSNGDHDDDDDETSKDSATTGSTSTPQAERTGHEGQSSRYIEPTMSLLSGVGLPQHPQQLLGPSVANATIPYPEMYYGGMMTPYGPQPMIPPSFYGMHQPRMPLPLEMAQEPVYVNAKQYHGILRRRQVRAKAELERKLIKERKPYLHESRHQHALRRARGTGGRFVKKGGAESSNHSAKDQNRTSGGSQSYEAHEKREDNLNGSTDNRHMEGQSNQQWGNGSMSSDQVSHRALAMR